MLGLPPWHIFNFSFIAQLCSIDVFLKSRFEIFAGGLLQTCMQLLYACHWLHSLCEIFVWIELFCLNSWRLIFCQFFVHMAALPALLCDSRLWLQHLTFVEVEAGHTGILRQIQYPRAMGYLQYVTSSRCDQNIGSHQKRAMKILEVMMKHILQVHTPYFDEPLVLFQHDKICFALDWSASLNPGCQNHTR